MHMTEPPTALMSPAVLSRIVLHKMTTLFRTGKKRDFAILRNPAIINDVITDNEIAVVPSSDGG
jgi:hypothetical protein